MAKDARQHDPMAIQNPGLPLRACLLSGGESRRMGRDKALLPHPAGDCWLEQSLRRLATLELPIAVFSRHPLHRKLTEQLAGVLDREGSAASGIPRPRTASLTAITEPPPWEGPLLALQRLMELFPEERLLLCPVDMPALTTGVLCQLLEAAAKAPTAIHLAHDGERLQPLLGIYPSDAGRRASLTAAIASGERRLQNWLGTEGCRAVELDPRALQNINRPEQLAGR